MGSELKSFCSEKCFAACRRAYFKRNKLGYIRNYTVSIPYFTLLFVRPEIHPNKHYTTADKCTCSLFIKCLSFP
ncbi:hypothetical protein ATANTOWER_019742 [Ataeniobius toweri]|uniref:Uncharacterized protein n=1 Tax=Ataeniobius toweri TaxID=208326 RepID=A0ABU7C1M1_9TELE|nr:hypothetical protein [Ataeniobius toweri]